MYSVIHYILYFSETEDTMTRDEAEDPEWSRLAKALSLYIRPLYKFYSASITCIV